MKAIIIIIAAVILSIIGIGAYLSPEDLADCGAKPSGIKGCGKKDAIVAVSGGDTSARTSEAIKLYKRGWADTLVFSGAAQDTTGPSNAEAMRRQAVADGVPEAAIIVEELSQNTRENAAETHALLEEQGIGNVILVTSAYHQRRASLEFKTHMGESVEIFNHPVANDNQWSQLWWMTPTGWWLALSELFKIGAFYIGGAR